MVTGRTFSEAREHALWELCYERFLSALDNLPVLADVTFRRFQWSRKHMARVRLACYLEHMGNRYDYGVSVFTIASNDDLPHIFTDATDYLIDKCQELYGLPRA